jgi:hypothetical protein
MAYLVKLNLMNNMSNDKARIMQFAMIMAKSFFTHPYISQVETFASKIRIVHKDKSPTNFVFQAL